MPIILRKPKPGKVSPKGEVRLSRYGRDDLGIVGCWPQWWDLGINNINDGSGQLTDISGNEAHIYQVGGSTQWPGWFSTFDISKQLNLPAIDLDSLTTCPDLESNTGTILHQSGDVTFGLWTQLQSVNGAFSSLMAYIEDAETEASNTQYGLFFNGNTFKLLYIHEFSTGTNQTSGDYTLSTAVPYRIVCTRDASAKLVRVYVNGVERITYNYTTQPSGGTTAKLHIGGYSTISKCDTAFAVPFVANKCWTKEHVLKDFHEATRWDMFASKRTVFLPAAVGGGFKSAWAYRANTLIGGL